MSSMPFEESKELDARIILWMKTKRPINTAIPSPLEKPMWFFKSSPDAVPNSGVCSDEDTCLSTIMQLNGPRNQKPSKIKPSSRIDGRGDQAEPRMCISNQHSSITKQGTSGDKPVATVGDPRMAQ